MILTPFPFSKKIREESELPHPGLTYKRDFGPKPHQRDDDRPITIIKMEQRSYSPTATQSLWQRLFGPASECVGLLGGSIP